MNFIDIIIAAGAVSIVISVICLSIRKGKNGGCCGGCKGCNVRNKCK